MASEEMTYILNVTIGGQEANSYIAVNQADAYHAVNLHREAWAAADPKNKERALVTATRKLDERYKWHGKIANPDQALGWPRTGASDKEDRPIPPSSIPRKLQEATAELAFWFIDLGCASSQDVIPEIVDQMVRGGGLAKGDGDTGSIPVRRT